MEEEDQQIVSDAKGDKDRRLENRRRQEEKEVRKYVPNISPVVL